MNRYIKVEDFEEELNQRNFQKVYEIIILKTYDLISELKNEKKLDVQINLKDTSYDNIFHISRILKENSISFEYLITLLDELCNWDTDPINPSLPDIEITKIEQYIRLYNYSISEYKDYLKLKKELAEKNVEKEKQKKIENLISTFKNMMNYKNKVYQEKWSFFEWIYEIDHHYHFYHELLKDALSLVYQGVIDIDIVLKEGQTYSDVFHEKKEQLATLMKEMLDDIHVTYEQDEFYYLCNLISEHYPYIDQLESTYQYFKKDYKNREKNMKSYQKEQKDFEILNNEFYLS